MRQIKFRVRDTNTKKVLGYERINSDGHWEQKRVNRTDWVLGAITGEDNLIREQLTEYEDMLGKEMYEGHVIEYDEFARRNPKKGLLMEVKIPDIYHWRSGMVNIKVIGNICENPELLNPPHES